LDNQQMNITIRLTICLFAMLCMGGTAGSLQDERALGFYHIHTTEQLSVTYYRDGEYLPEAMDQLQAFLADWRDKERKDIDPRLLDILWDIKQASGMDSTFEVISAYRSRKTNEHLRAATTGVEKHSLHLQGRAIDVRLNGVDTQTLRDIALELKRGGVGYYSESNFVHVDTGQVRSW
jgi:uncharacterized protein YcbK (DUF882 family)